MAPVAAVLEPPPKAGKGEGISATPAAVELVHVQVPKIFQIVLLLKVDKAARPKLFPSRAMSAEQLCFVATRAQRFGAGEGGLLSAALRGGADKQREMMLALLGQAEYAAARVEKFHRKLLGTQPAYHCRLHAPQILPQDHVVVFNARADDAQIFVVQRHDLFVVVKKIRARPALQHDVPRSILLLPCVHMKYQRTLPVGGIGFPLHAGKRGDGLAINAPVGKAETLLVFFHIDPVKAWQCALDRHGTAGDGRSVAFLRFPCPCLHLPVRCKVDCISVVDLHSEAAPRVVKQAAELAVAKGQALVRL